MSRLEELMVSHQFFLCVLCALCDLVLLLSRTHVP